MDFDLRQAKSKQRSYNWINALHRFAVKGIHLNDDQSEVIIPSVVFSKERARLCRKYGFRFHGGEYPQWYRKTSAQHAGRQWSSEQWLDLARKIEAQSS